ncbi:MAG: hypothetical protein F4056_09435 [Chloroflexi bacterium]|nr:hypothetical protein [Chloroflexota bacterium]
MFDVVAAAAAIAPRIRAAADTIEAERQLPDDIVEAMAKAKLFTLLAPAAYGGAEAEPTTAIRAIELISAADGSAGWRAQNGSFESALLGWLSPEAIAGMRALESRGARDFLVGGANLPQATAVDAVGGYVIDGRWDFVSGVMHSNWILGGFGILDGPGGARRVGADGEPLQRIAFIPHGDGEVLDTWNVMGMRGTGSNDFVVRDLFVPAERTMWYADPAPFPGPRYRRPYIGAWGWSLHGGNSLGMARGAIEDLSALAQTHDSKHSTSLLRNRPHVQRAIAEAEAIVRSARAFLFEAVEEAWIAANSDAPDAVRLNWEARLALMHSAHEALRAVQLLYDAAGTNAIFTAHRIERALRDLNVAKHHVAASKQHYESVGSILLGADNPATLPLDPAQ